MDLPFLEKVAVVTGGGRGIGAATARLLASRGAQVAIISRTENEIQEVKSSIQKDFGHDRGMAIVADVSSEKAVRAAFNEVRSQWGPIRILVNNAGIITHSLLTDMTTEQWDHLMAINLRGTFLCSQQAFLHMQEKKRGGSIVNISSLGGIRSTTKFEGFSAYVASKHGIVGLTEALAVEGKSHGIRVNCVAPGAVNTQMLRTAVPFLKTQTQPQDIAEVIAYLCDEARSGCLSGTTLEVHSNA